MPRYFKNIRDDFGTPTPAETVELERIAKEIETLIFLAHKNGETHVVVSADLWRTPFFRFHLAKDLIKTRIFMVDPPSSSLSSNMRISWCNEDILDMHRKYRLVAIEKLIRPTYDIVPEYKHVPSPIYEPGSTNLFGSPKTHDGEGGSLVFGTPIFGNNAPSRRHYAFDILGTASDAEPSSKRVKQDAASPFD